MTEREELLEARRLLAEFVRMASAFLDSHCTCPDLVAYGWMNPLRPRREGDPHLQDCPRWRR